MAAGPDAPIGVGPNAASFKDKLCFLAEWFDYDSAYRKKFLLNFYLWDGTIELYDRELQRMFLRRTKMESVTLDDMFLGNTIRVYGRQVKITDCADCRTQKFVDKTKNRTLALLKPIVVEKLGEIITRVQREGFTISKMRMCQMTRKEALLFYEHRRGESELPFTLEQVVNGPVVAMELVGEDAVNRFIELMGPKDPIEARKVRPDSLRALYGIDSRATSGFHGAPNAQVALDQLEFFFPESPNNIPSTTIKLENTTCCVVKPHAIHEGKLGHIISIITQSHFKITAAQMIYLSSTDAEEFLEVYKGVVPDYNALVKSFLDGPCVALEISGKIPEMDVHGEFRKFCGPQDSEIARQIRPNTLRAMFGCDKYKNAVHCTDLPEDTKLELEYFFKILWK